MISKKNSAGADEHEIQMVAKAHKNAGYKMKKISCS